MTFHSKLLVLAVAAGAALAGCDQPNTARINVPMPEPCYGRVTPEPVAAAPTPTPPPRRGPVRRPEPEPAPTGRSVQGRTITCHVFGAGDETVLFIGGIHGNEAASATLCKRLCLHLRARPEAAAGRRIVVVPAANPDGLAANTRANSRGVDLNRNFDSRNRKAIRRFGLNPLSEPESRFLQAVIDRYEPCRIVSVHQPLACVDYDGPARDLAAAIATASGLPVRKLGARPGSLGSAAGVDRKIPIVTLELPPGNAGGEGPLWRTYGDALLAAITHGDGSFAK